MLVHNLTSTLIINAGSAVIEMNYVSSRLNSSPTWKYKEMCGIEDSTKGGESIYNIDFPGNFSSDAEFFVFTGVIAWLYCFVRFASTK